MFGGSAKDTDGDGPEEAFFKPVKNPRRPRDAGPETGDDDKPSGGSPQGGSKRSDDRQDKGDAMGDATGGADGKPGRRRRADDAADPKTAASRSGSAAWMTSPEKRTSTLVIEQDDIDEARNHRKHHCADDNEDIMVIPDLDEDGGDADQRVAHAPRNVHRKVCPVIRHVTFQHAGERPYLLE